MVFQNSSIWPVCTCHQHDARRRRSPNWWLLSIRKEFVESEIELFTTEGAIPSTVSETERAWLRIEQVSNPRRPAAGRLYHDNETWSAARAQATVGCIRQQGAVTGSDSGVPGGEAEKKQQPRGHHISIRLRVHRPLEIGMTDESHTTRGGSEARTPLGVVRPDQILPFLPRAWRPRSDQIRSTIAAPLTLAGVSSLGQVSKARSPDPTKPSKLATGPGAYMYRPRSGFARLQLGHFLVLARADRNVIIGPT